MPSSPKRPLLLLIQPAQESDRLGTKRRRTTGFPKVTLPLLAAYAEERFDVRIVDESVDDIDFRMKPDLVAVTVLTLTSKRAYEIADAFRKEGVKVVLGGPHVYFFPEEAAKHADALVLREAETAWPPLLKDFLNGDMKARYEGEHLHDMKGLPRPRLELLRRNAYHTVNVIETGRGCPHRCTYCSVTLYWGHTFRLRPIEEVIEEIRSMPPGEIAFIDDNIIGSPRRAKELFRAITPLKRTWASQADLKIARDPELLRLCAESGCRWLFMGLESVNSENIADVGKSRTNPVEEYAASIATIHQAGIKVLGSFIFGLDHDTSDVFDNTVDFCIRNGLAAANFYIFTPMPFTKLFDEMKDDGRILHEDWSRYDANHVVFKPKNMTPEELMEGYLGAYRSFYGTSSILRRTLQHLPRRPLQVLAYNLARKFHYKRFREVCEW
ncbi:MAG: B12-binding domain-containing radical SAM protein [Deltaproteobacteria bacterium]|nr:B12-binding domain-containing radical SAM protein [Deltaproteobacteria bacterium]